nr:surfeit locus protein 6 homolog [Cherax quadricarinatus]
MAKDVLGVNSVINEVPKSKKRHRSRVANEMNTKTVTESYNIVSKFNKKNKKSKQKGNVESKDPLSSEQEPYQKKKKKKGNKNTEGSRKRSHLELNNRETEDAAESIDSGCIADNNSDIAADLTDWPQVKSVLLEENKFISNFLKWMPAPQKADSEEGYHVPQAKRDNRGSRKVQSEKKFKGEEKCADLAELQEKYLSTLAALKGNRKKVWDPAARKKESKLKKKLSRLQYRKNKRQKTNIKHEGINQQVDVETEKGFSQGTKSQKHTIYNQEGKLVFSKFDFSNTSTSGEIDTSLKPTDLKQLLSKALKEKEKIKRMEQKGHTKKASEVIEQSAWSSALQKAEGVKVRNDVDLIKKTIKKKESNKKTSQKTWEQRKEIIEKKKTEKLNTRKKNIKIRKEAKLNKKMKKMKNRGHIVPGF